MRIVSLSSVAVLALVLILASGCSSRKGGAPGTASGTPPGGVPTTHVVRRDETLYRISMRYGLDWRDVAYRNGIPPPYLIYPGQRLRLAGAGPVSRPAVAAPARQPPPPATPTSPSSAAGTPVPGPPPAAGPAPAGGAPQWQWPSDGPLLRGFSGSGTTRRGIAIGGRKGDEVRAAAAGEVVYAGSGLVGYGRLIILKHDARFISAYGHNDEMLVREGETVRAGQRIARLGDSGAERPMLHFEIRVDGTPVDPVRYLPRR